jgi:hypothetical protein
LGHQEAHDEHHAVTVSTEPSVDVRIHSDVYVLKFNDASQGPGPRWSTAGLIGEDTGADTILEHDLPAYAPERSQKS